MDSTSHKKIVVVALVMAVIMYLYYSVKNEEKFKQRIYVIQNYTAITKFCNSTENKTEQKLSPNIKCIEKIYNLEKTRHVEEWMKKIKERFEFRKKNLKEGCEILDKGLHYSTAITLKEHLYISQKHKLLVCIVAKAGATTWKTHLYTINTGRPSARVHTPETEKQIRAAFMMSSVTINEKFNNGKYIRVMNARHPLDRLVSAYRDKYRDGAGPKASVFKKYVYQLRDSTVNTSNITFTEFLQMVVDNKKHGKENHHWKNYYSTCSACELPYDYIMKVETHTEDLRYIFKMAGITEVDVEAQYHATSVNKKTSDHVYGSDSSYMSYYEGVDYQLIKDIHYLYKEDYQLFGYEIPQFVQNIIENKK